MHRAKKTPVWRLKVINGCNRNDDLPLPLVPQSSMLWSFYAQWCDEDEEHHYTSKRIAAGYISADELVNKAKSKKRKKRTRAASSALHCISTHDWLHKIPHVPLGRHTFLPAQYRLRHGCVSRLHCRVAYVSDATTHKQLLLRYPLKKRTSPNGFCSTDRTLENVNNNTHSVTIFFTEPYYLLINCSLNQLYVNNELLPCGQSCCLHENDILAFLENPFDDEGGILEPLRSGDDIRDDDVVGDFENTHAPCCSTTTTDSKVATARELFGGASADCAATQLLWPVRSSTFGPQHVFLEVNGVRIARYRPQCVPPAVLQRIGAPTAAVVVPCETPLKQQNGLVADQNHLFGSMKKDNDDDDDDKWIGPAQRIIHSEVMDVHVDPSFKYAACGKGVCLTPPPLSRPFAYGKQTPHETKSADDALDIIDDVISPLRQWFSPTTQRNSSHPSSPQRQTNMWPAKDGNKLPPFGSGRLPSTSSVPPRLPVYVFTRRSPSPENFTRQAFSIPSVQLRARSKEEGRDCAAVDGKEEEEEGETKWVDEEVLSTASRRQKRRNGTTPTRKRRRANY